jgi:molybdenum cofactor sulfurtransferase
MSDLIQLNTSEIQILEHAKTHMTHDAQHYETVEKAFISQHSEIDFEALTALRQDDYSRLDNLGHIYLDYTGGGLYAQSQLQKHMDLLLNGVYGNPHSSNPTSMAMTELDEQAREYILRYFNADPDEYCVIFTSNASGALHLIGESYPFEDNGHYLLAYDNHNSVNGIREYARSNGAKLTYTPVLPPDMRLDDKALVENLDKAIPDGNNLFAFPAQSNFSGVQHPLDWIETAHEKGWDVLLDCAAFAPTNRLDLGVVKPEFVTLSFYKMFGYPTGIGALIARRSVLNKLRRPWFAGGTVSVVSVQGDAHYMDEGHAAFEDGTIDYLNIPAIETGLRHIEAIGLDAIHNRVVAFTEYLLDELTALTHENGTTLVKVYGPITTENRGGTLAVNLFDADGTIFDDRLVEYLANQFNISLRSGCFCNPGAGELALNISEEYAKKLFQNTERMTYEQYAMAVASDDEHDGIGAVRISVGLITNFNDVYQMVQFAKSFLNIKSDGIRLTSSQC